MGSVAVAMVDEPPSFALKKVHPFFNTSRSSQVVVPADTTSSAAESSAPGLEDGQGTEFPVPEEMTVPGHKRKKPESSEGHQLEKRKPGRPRKKERPSSGATIKTHFKNLHEDSPSPSHSTTSGKGEPESNSEGGDPRLSMTETLPPAPSANLAKDNPQGETVQASQLALPPTSHPKRQLKFDLKTGTLGSLQQQGQAAEQSKELPRSPTPSLKEQVRLLALVRYGNDDESRIRIGNGIDAILRGATSYPLPGQLPPSGSQADRTKRVISCRSADQPTTTKTHPLFLGKMQPPKTTRKEGIPEPSSKPATGLKHFTSTPCSPRRARQAPSTFHLPKFGVKNSGLKIPGAQLAAWPWKEMAHVRGSEPFELFGDAPLAYLSARKSKGHTVSVGSDESILECKRRQLDVPGILETIRNVDTDSFIPPPPELRLPRKHFESGRKLQRRIAPGLKPLDPSLQRLFDSVETTLSASDRSQCETLSWTQKYAPACAAEVLQCGREPFLLREWLRGLTVQSVNTGIPDSVASSSAKRRQKTSAEKKKRKRNKLEGFVVSSDDEADEMDVVSDDDADWAPSGRYGVPKKTVIRAGDAAAMGSKEGGRLTNAVVISGPHGCGKTAAVYAVAKELDFEVFEINSSSRRAGKDVLEKIGDMTKYHLVQQQSAAAPADISSAISTEEVAMEIDSGRQATMDSFFKAKGRPKHARPSSTKQSHGKDERNDTNKPATSSKKQSLILLEEVDILYEEDKTFWATVMSLISQSKRPFVMTCNDETLLPLQGLALHGIFRFTPPALDTAVDRLLLIAANEGHALQRSAVAALYDCRGRDFRGSLTELNFWCQIGVGDRRGGFEWFYLRWPKGIDLDEEGQVVRVVSQDTYREGMGWVCHDALAHDGNHGGAEEDLIQQTWRSWGVDMAQWHDSLDMGSWTSRGAGQMMSSEDRLAALRAYDGFADAMSVADIVSSGAFAEGYQENIDATLPGLSNKVRDDYPIGLQLLEAPTLSTYESTSADIAIWLKSATRERLRTAQGHGPPASELSALREPDVISTIRQRDDRPGCASSQLRRIDFSFAFDPIASSDHSQPATRLDASVFDGTMTPIVLDVAPYVRGIVAYDLCLQRQRLKLSNLVSQGGRGPKRIRTTRAAMSALEGGTRSTTRKERWFKADMNTEWVMHTAGEGWLAVVAEAASSSTTRETSRTRHSAASREGLYEGGGGSGDDTDELA